MEKPKKIDGFEEYVVQGAASTLIEAEEIKRKPKLLAAARKLITQKLAATQAAAKK